MRGVRRTLLALAATVAAGALAVGGTAAVAIALTAQVPAAPSARFAAEPVSAALPAGVGGLAPSAHDRSPAVGPALAPSEPVAIDIPAIDVRSPLHDLGMTPAGTLRVPSGSRYDEAAWYNRSASPGARGPAVIIGHVDSPHDGPSVFFKLADLRRHDRVLVTRADGQVAVFEVDAVRSYAKDRFPTRLVYGDTRHAALRLITCGGTFDRTTGHYVDNVVVFASMVGAREASPATRHR